MTTVAVQTDDIIYNHRSSKSASEQKKGANMYWSYKAYMKWRVQYALPFVRARHELLVNDKYKIRTHQIM